MLHIFVFILLCSFWEGVFCLFVCLFVVFKIASQQACLVTFDKSYNKPWSKIRNIKKPENSDIEGSSRLHDHIIVRRVKYTGTIIVCWRFLRICEWKSHKHILHKITTGTRDGIKTYLKPLKQLATITQFVIIFCNQPM